MLMVCGASSACFCKLQNYKSYPKGHTFSFLPLFFVSYLFPSLYRAPIMGRVLWTQVGPDVASSLQKLPANTGETRALVSAVPGRRPQ